MTDWFLALVPDYGLWLVALTTFLSCLALPVPSSMLMLAAGGFAAAGDLTLTGAARAALAGAILSAETGPYPLIIVMLVSCIFSVLATLYVIRVENSLSGDARIERSS